MSERALWAAVAETAINDHAKLIAAAQNGKRRALSDNSNNGVAVGTAEAEIAAARRYFESSDWRMVASLAGINLGPDDIMPIIINGWRPYRVSHRVNTVQGAV